MNTTGTGADFHERSNLACLGTTVLIYPALLVWAFQDPTPGTLLALLIAGVVMQVAALAVLHIITALVTRQEPDDERVAAIGQRSDRLSGIVLSVGVFGVISLTIAQGFLAPSEPGAASFGSPVLTGLVLLACFVTAELVRMGHAAILYRKG